MKEERQMKVLLDVDTGVDDSIALLYALFNPEIEIVGISAVCGNVEAWLAAENTSLYYYGTFHSSITS